MRHHIRHDFREEFDNEENERKNDRAKRLKLDPRLQVDISCKLTYIKVGGIIITIKEINDYLKWVEEFNDKILKEARENGFLKTGKD